MDKIKMMRLLLLAAFLAGCASTATRAPIEAKRPVTPKMNSVQVQADQRPQTYVVKKGDTLFGIALEFGLDYRDLVKWNAISDRNHISTGTELRLYPPGAEAQTKPLSTAPAPSATTYPLRSAPPAAVPQPSQPAQAPVTCPTCNQMVKAQPLAIEKPYSEETWQQMSGQGAQNAPQQAPQANQPSSEVDGVDWIWPAEGKVIAGYNDTANLKGIDIAGKMGEPILASASGKVVYTGNGLRGYGNLIIIKHNKTYLSAYAHNSKILVHEGQEVGRGEKIGEMGESDAKQVMLHFEIRRFGKPVDPMQFLKAGNHDQGAHR